MRDFAHQIVYSSIFERPFVKRFALCYQTVVCSLCDVGILWPNGCMDGSRWNLACG